jgi:hypothetical protein
MKEAEASASFYLSRSEEGKKEVALMAKEMSLVRDKVYDVVFEDLFMRYVLKKIRKDYLKRDIDDLVDELRALGDIYYYLRGKITGEVKDVVDELGEAEFVRFLYSVLLGVLDVAESLGTTLGDMIEEIESE